MGIIEAICISKKKGVSKKEILNAVFVKNWGIKGDAHAGKWHRQVSLLAGESIDRMKEQIPTLKRGAFAENIITRGIALNNLHIGDRLSIGNKAILQITQIGKECHKPCAIKKAVGDCIMPREGVFASILHGGIIKQGNNIHFYYD
jgi:MOSC domain-containing protein YiiM